MGEVGPRLKDAGDFTLQEAESIRLILRGDSVIDWHRLNFGSSDDVRAFLRTHEIDPDNAKHRDYLERLKSDAIGYLRRNFSFAIPRPVETAAVEELLLLASGKGHRQMCACTILKVVQIIGHMAGRELLFRLPVSDRDLFHLVEEKIYRIVGTMLTEGFPITEFIGGRKNLDSIYTKLLSKPEATSAAVYDKLRFRIVTRTRDDLLPVILYLTEHVFPFNFVMPRESTNTVVSFYDFCAEHPRLREMLPQFQGVKEEPSPAGANRFSAPNYRVIHFVADIPVRVPPHVMELAPPGAGFLGDIAYMLCEFQLLDSETDSANERGDASHDAYKLRQRLAVSERLRLGARHRSPRPPRPSRPPR